MNGLKEAASMAQMAQVGRGMPQDAETQPREISMVLEELRGNIGRFECLVDRLGSRLNAVITSAPPIVAENQKTMQCRGTDMGNYIDGMRLQLRDANNNLESIIERIEL